MYVFQLFDFYGASGMVLLWYCFFEAVVIGWVYGADRFYNNIEQMIGFKIFRGFKFCWKWLTPAITSITFMTYVLNHKSIKYNGTYEYPAWGITFGWCLAMFSILMFPASLIHIWMTTKGSCKEVTKNKQKISTRYLFHLFLIFFIFLNRNGSYSQHPSNQNT